MQDPRIARTIWLTCLAVTAILMGMALGKLDSGVGTRLTGFTLILAAVGAAIFLFLLVRDVWKRDAPRP
jgi:hypothetical protein